MSKPGAVEQWIQSLPQTCTPPTPSFYSSPTKSPRRFLPRDISLQSDDSHCSSVESVLELRKPDPEAVLLGLGFGPTKSSNILNKIPQRFLQQSKLISNIDMQKFLEQYGESKCDQHSNTTSQSRNRPKSF